MDTSLIANEGLAEQLVVGQPASSANAPGDLFMASGAGGQRLYIIPSRQMVVVRQGEGDTFDDDEFLALLPDE